jgi:hypothetical protein
VKHLWLVTIISASCSAADPASKVERVAIEVAKTSPAKCLMERPAALTKNVVLMRPGETICVDVEVRDQAIFARGLVATPTDSTLIFQAWRDGADTFLRVQHSLDVSLRYEAVMAPAGEEMKMERTSTCPVMPKMFSLEHWPYPVVVMAFSEFSVADSRDLACR